MAGTIFEIDPNYTAQSENGQIVENPYIVTGLGTFSLSGSEITMQRTLADQTKQDFTIPVPTEAQLKAIYDSNAAFAKYISPPEGYSDAPWQNS